MPMQPEQLTQFLSSIPAMNAEKKVKLYLKLREHKAAANKAHEEAEAEVKLIMQTIENHMLADADKAGVTGFTTPYGTTYTAETKKISIADDSAFFAHVLEQKDLDFFERRVSSTHVDAVMKENGGTAPPGLNIFRERVMRIRKASEK